MAIVAVGAAAHGGCLHATWFLDDWGKIVLNPNADIHMGDLGLSALTELTYHLLGGGGFACHLGNLLFHLLFACLIWWLGPLFLNSGPTARKAAFFGALVFAVHPLCSEVTHYARARDHELVALFSFLTAACTVLWLKRGWRWAPALAIAMGLAVLAKGPGPAHAALAVAAVCLCFGEKGELRRRLSSRWTAYAAIIAPLALTVFFPSQALGWTDRITESWEGGLFGLHFLTQCRVFWEYVARMIWPADLCPDHLVAYTKNIGDLPAWLGLAGIAGWMIGVVLLWRQGYRTAAFLLFMVAANLLLRWFYVLSELMVEYRTYPSMPWLGLLAGMGLAWIWARHRIMAAIVLAGTLTAGIAVTRQRSAVWASTETLTDSILRQYPWQLRAYMERTYVDYHRRGFAAAPPLLPEFQQRLREVLAWNAASPHRAYANWPLWAVCVEGNVAECLIGEGRYAEAKEILERTRVNMEKNQLVDPLLWASWYWGRAKLENRQEQYAAARLDLERVGDMAFDPAEYKAEMETANRGTARAARRDSIPSAR